MFDIGLTPAVALGTNKSAGLVSCLQRQGFPKKTNVPLPRERSSSVERNTQKQRYVWV